MIMIIRIIIFTVLLTSLLIAQDKREFVSPDKSTKIVVIDFKHEGASQESSIRIVNIRGTVLFDTSFTSEDGEHGSGVDQTAWTTNSQFFVFSLASSGGHQSWHYPTFAYSVSKNRLISLDAVLGPVTSEFRLIQPDSLVTVGFTTNIDEEVEFHLRLSSLIKEIK